MTTDDNVVRHTHRDLSDEEKQQISDIKDAGRDAIAMLDGYDSYGGSRELSIAKTKIEEAVMWAVKHITR